ncbi:uncharacterized protein PFLUO_LOCUS5372 [Penicillium psychrofluorescens]|uniref:uncharacterized protein n=1 Tax=Penicillium psychrofluorescens TaxID=3158075 RepID=UPI003CCE02E7
MATDEDMEGVQVENKKRASVDIDNVKRKKFKADDLPLSGAQHAAIDKLLHSFKKKGGFDSVRKKIWAEFNEGDSKTKFTDQLIALAESEIDREPALLSRERGKAATLIEGAVDRGDVYKNVEDSIDNLAANHLEFILDSVRGIRRQDVGDEVASREEQSGNKTDEEYDVYIKAKREEREKVWREEMRKQKEVEEEQKRIKEEELRKKREMERQKEEEERARRKELEEKRRAEERERDEQRERERQERYERRRREDRDRFHWDRDQDRSRSRDRHRYRDRSPAHRADRGVSPRPRDATKKESSSTSKDPTPAPPPPAPVDEKSLEEAALQMLLKEGEELAAKARQKPEFDFEEAEAIENGLKPGAAQLAHRLETSTDDTVQTQIALNGPVIIHEIEAGVAPAAHLHLVMRRIAATVGPETPEIVTWTNDVDIVTSATMIEATDPAAAAAAGRLPVDVIAAQNGVNDLDPGTPLGTMIGDTRSAVAVATKKETALDAAVTPNLPHDPVTHLHDRGDVHARGPLRDNAHASAPGPALDPLDAAPAPVAGLALADLLPQASTSTDTSPLQAIAADHHAAARGLRNRQQQTGPEWAISIEPMRRMIVGLGGALPVLLVEEVAVAAVGAALVGGGAGVEDGVAVVDLNDNAMDFTNEQPMSHSLKRPRDEDSYTPPTSNNQGNLPLSKKLRIAAWLSSTPDPVSLSSDDTFATPPTLNDESPLSTPPSIRMSHTPTTTKMSKRDEEGLARLSKRGMKTTGHGRNDELPQASSSDDEPTSSSGSSSSESESESESENENQPPHTTTTAAAAANNPATASAEPPIPNITGRPKPQIRRMDGDSGLLSRLSSFLPQMKDANESLQKDIAAGTAGDIILDSSLDIRGSGDEDDEEEDEDMEKGEGGGEGKWQRQYIEMNLGLGVLEEKREDGSTAEESPDSHHPAKDASAAPKDSNVLGKLMKTKQSSTEKPTIEEMAE